MRRSMIGRIAARTAILVLALAGATAAPSQETPAGLAVDRAVMLMRHGVRPPTRNPAMPAGTASGTWPAWPVNPGWLTPHGATAIGRLGASDGARFRMMGLLPAQGCPATGSVRIVADSDERTIATADRWSAALAPGCALPGTHKPQDEDDPVWSPIGTASRIDAAAANAAIATAVGPGGIAALEARQRPLLQRLDAILCDGQPHCGVSATPSAIAPATADKRPKLSGALDRASTAAQILLLEYADGKPMAEVGFGRATPADVTALSAFHALEFRLLARPLPLARANLALITPQIVEALTAPTAARVTLFSGHDTQVANLGGLLDVHWHIAGYAPDDPAPGGALVIERLHDRAGNRYVRVAYRAQPLDALRAGSGTPVRQPLPIAGCTALGQPGLCTLDRFVALLKR